MQRELALSIWILTLSCGLAVGAEEDDPDTQKKQMSEYMMSLGSFAPIRNQMTRDGRSDSELESALVQAFESLASCTVDAVVEQANRQNLPATPVLRMMSGIYTGPDDVESLDEIETIRSFDFDAVEAGKEVCQEKFMDDIG